MKEISYANETFVTSDSMADAVLEYATALGENDSADTIDVPILLDDGAPSSIQILIGPASQLTSRPVESPFAEPDGSEFLAWVSNRVNRLQPSQPHAEPVSDQTMLAFDDFDEVGYGDYGDSGSPTSSSETRP